MYEFDDLLCTVMFLNKYPFQGQSFVNEVTYKRFKKGIIQKSSRQAPAASTPMASGGQCDPRRDLDAVCQRLDLEDPQTHQEPEDEVQLGNDLGIVYITLDFLVLFLSAS